jgi:hypothetical protein
MDTVTSCIAFAVPCAVARVHHAGHPQRLVIYNHVDIKSKYNYCIGTHMAHEVYSINRRACCAVCASEKGALILNGDGKGQGSKGNIPGLLSRRCGNYES